MCKTQRFRKMMFSSKSIDIFLNFSHKHVVLINGSLAEVLLMRTHNIHFHGKIRKIFIWIPILPGAMKGKCLDQSVHHYSCTI